ncbi:MAG: hypothetical protein FWG88_07945 [Oscillospiraceae bacterium]|nr:hypothetical protein [Oscillospiraceae bacterium]
MKLTIRYKRGTLVITICLLLLIPAFFIANSMGLLQNKDKRETIVAWTPTVKPLDSTTYKPSALTASNHAATLTRPYDININGGTGGTTKDSPQYSYYSRGWNTASQYWLLSEISTAGYNDIELSFWTKGSATGPKDFTLEYSHDAVTWLPLTDNENFHIKYTVGSEGKYIELGPYKLNASMENIETLYIRFLNVSTLSVSGATTQSSGTNYLTDIIITGIPIENES